MTVTSVPLLSRIWLAWVTSFRILFDGSFAAQVVGLRGENAAPAAPGPAALPLESPLQTPQAPRKDANSESPNAALQLLSLLQREGRFVDFVQQDLTSFSDADIGAAARVVHEGCRRAIRAHAPWSACAAKRRVPR